jgi:hypothetical protein
MNHTKEPCTYCNGDLALLCKDGGLSIRINDSDLLVDHDGDELVIHDDVKLNYCPMCGRKLEDV